MENNYPRTGWSCKRWKLCRFLGYVTYRRINLLYTIVKSEEWWGWWRGRGGEGCDMIKRGGRGEEGGRINLECRGLIDPFVFITIMPTTLLTQGFNVSNGPSPKLASIVTSTFINCVRILVYFSTILCFFFFYSVSCFLFLYSE